MSIKSFDDAHDFYPAAAPVATGIIAKLRLVWLAFTDRGITTRRASHPVSEIYPGR